MRVISIANFKGGTGKTVTACNMAAIMAGLGKRVLLVDADPQHNATAFFKADGATLTEILEGLAEPYWPDVVTPSGREGLDLVGADMGLLRLDLAAIANGSSEAIRRMADFIGVLKEDDAYDFVIFDCPPSFTAASVAALMQTDDVILPTRVDAFSQAGIRELIGQIKSLGRLSAGVRYHVLITMADRTNLCRQGTQLLRESGLNVFRAEIRDCVKVGESTFAREPLIDYAPKATATLDYRAATLEYLEEVRKDG